MALHVAVVLSGCGKNDGSEIQEAVCVLVHFSRHGAAVSCFAPNKPQADVIDHAAGAPARETRNVMVESARISRGAIAPLASLEVARFDALVFPGGFGAAKNLCTFARDGANCTVDPDVERVIRAFRAAGKPIALCCIAPVLAAKVLGVPAAAGQCALTIGADEGTAAAIRAMGASHVEKRVTEALVDREHRIITTPAYMCDASPFEVFQGIGAMIDATMELARR